jgi:sortase A
MGKRIAPKPITIITVIGEIFITAGLVLLLYVGWQVFINDPVVSQQQQTQSNKVPTGLSGENQFSQISTHLKQGKVFGKLFIPRFANDYQRLIGQGTFQKVTLNKIGPGHYLNSQWPGEAGNFAVAAHRTSHGAPFNKIDTLQQGDRVYVETNDGWFTYEYRQTAIVDPSDISVISPVPKGLVDAKPGGKYMTMTSCHPKWSNKQRIVVWLELVDQRLRDQGMPPDLKRKLGNE